MVMLSYQIVKIRNIGCATRKQNKPLGEDQQTYSLPLVPCAILVQDIHKEEI
jgi:hypothetical protein